MWRSKLLDRGAERKDTIEGHVEWRYHWDVQVECQRSSWISGPQLWREVWPQDSFDLVSHHHRVGHKSRWDFQEEFAELETGQDSHKTFRNAKEWFLEERPAKEMELKPKTALLSPGSQGAGVFQERGSGQECQTLEKSVGLITGDRFRGVGNQKLDLETASRDGSFKQTLQPASCLCLGNKEGLRRGIYQSSQISFM